MNNTFIIDNPMITDRLTVLRMKSTGTRKFREIVKEISTFLAYEVAREFPMRDVEIETPLCKTMQKRLDVGEISIVPILRAGVGMIEGFTTVYPDVRIINVGVERDHVTHKPVAYYHKMPKNIKGGKCIIIDPMLATGGSIEYTIQLLKDDGCADIVVVSILAAPEGLAAIHASHPEIPIYCAAVDDHLNEKKYIVPGLGDAGDRIFGTEE